MAPTGVDVSLRGFGVMDHCVGRLSGRQATTPHAEVIRCATDPATRRSQTSSWRGGATVGSLGSRPDSVIFQQRVTYALGQRELPSGPSPVVLVEALDSARDGSSDQRLDG